MTINIGANATFQGQGTHWITNTSSAGTKIITIGGTFGGSGSIGLAIQQAMQLSATIAETLTFAINGLPGEAFSGTDKMTGCTSIANNFGGLFAFEDEDNTAVFPVTTTAVTVPFGTVSMIGPTEGCQRLEIRTNAGNGYTITSRENNPLMTAGGYVIDDTTCDPATCTPTTAAAFAFTRGLGISCVNSATSASSSASNPNWNAGINWAPISADSKGLSPAKFSGVSSASSGLILAKVKYRLWPPASTPAGTYTNLVSFIATPVY